MCRIAVEVYASGGVKVEFVEGHVRKRELMRIIKCLKLEHRELIRKYRKKLLADKKVVPIKNNVIHIKEKVS